MAVVLPRFLPFLHCLPVNLLQECRTCESSIGTQNYFGRKTLRRGLPSLRQYSS